jgi:hypothetical protein
VVPKRLAAHEKRQSKGPVGAAAYAELVNSSSYGNHVAFSFPAINRGADVFPVDLAKLPHARQCCDVLYHRTRADGVAVREEGVVWFRMVTDAALPYELHDLLPREGKFMCAQCSNTTQEPVFHVDVGDCPRCTLPVDLTQQRVALATPAPARIQGPQVTKESKSGKPEQPKRKRKAAGDAAVGAFPCKSTFCSKLHYTTAGGSNRHMASKHPLELLQPYLNLPKHRKKRVPPAAPASAPSTLSSMPCPCVCVWSVLVWPVRSGSLGGLVAAGRQRVIQRGQRRLRHRARVRAGGGVQRDQREQRERGCRRGCGVGPRREREWRRGGADTDCRGYAFLLRERVVF